MKKVVRVLSVSLCLTLVAGSSWAADPFKSEVEKRSYAIGANMVKQLKQRKTAFDLDSIIKGLKDEDKGKAKLTDEQVAAVMQQLREDAQKKAKEDYEKLVADNKQRGDEYLAKNAKKEGVKVLEGGVQYRVLKQGDGKKPTEDDTVIVNYRGTLVDGTQFDASAADKPAHLKVEELIPGWITALTEMPVGSKWEIVVPSEKAYGKRGNGRNIGPNDTLIFEVELVGIE